MAEFNEQLQKLQGKLWDLNFRINENTSELSESDRISRIKRRFLNGPLSPLKISACHAGNPEGTVKVIPRKGKLTTTLLIDDLLEKPVQQLSYRISSFDPKIHQESGLGVIFQLNGIVRYEQFVFKHDPQTKDYHLIIKESPDFYLAGRILVIFDFEVDPNNYSESVDTDPQPLDLEGPSLGSVSRPSSKRNNDQLTKSENPFQ